MTVARQSALRALLSLGTRSPVGGTVLSSAWGLRIRFFMRWDGLCEGGSESAALFGPLQ